MVLRLTEISLMSTQQQKTRSTALQPTTRPYRLEELQYPDTTRHPTLTTTVIIITNIVIQNPKYESTGMGIVQKENVRQVPANFQLHLTPLPLQLDHTKSMWITDNHET